ncbi:MAG TPA: NFACT RNA binding domain-containing protein [Candidatus Nanoarchaeia archaeon]|nr:NFACT RNA binding domain-containing protein [Candidatus Nanoarchaeia archaeon]
MKVTIDIYKSVQDNASYYYERGKRSKKKIEGAERAYQETLKKIQNVELKKKKPVYVERKKHWFEKFKWYISSEGKLVIGGRDATTNDMIVKKYLEPNDLVFHTQLKGSPFVVIKTEGAKPTAQEKEEAAIFCAANSKQWNAGISLADVYYIKPDQVKKEFGLPKGSFMIYGDRTYLKASLELAIGVTKDNMVLCGPLTAIKVHCKNMLLVRQGSMKKSDAAKKVRYFLHQKEKIDIDLNEVMQALPPGDCDLKEV